MTDVGIRVNAERCTGCRVCQLICSITYQERFSPDEAYIRLEEGGPRYVEGCLDCGLCADHCPAGALEREGGIVNQRPQISEALT